MLVNQTFLYKDGSRRYKHLVVNGDRTFFTNEETSAGKKYDEILICHMMDFLIIIFTLRKVNVSAMYWYPHG